jgi:hypothetical protein
VIVIGSFNWDVPTPKKNKPRALVKVVGFNASAVRVDGDTSDEVFTIETVTITAPALNATVTAPSQVITWITNGTSAAVDSFDQAYAIGGLDDENNVLATVERYDAVTDQWDEIDPLPRGN